MAIYVQMLGGFWTLSDDELKTVLEKGAAGGGCVLPEDKQLRMKPGCIRATTDTTKASFFLEYGNHVFLQPIDWAPEDYQEELYKLQQRMFLRRKARKPERATA